MSMAKGRRSHPVVRWPPKRPAICYRSRSIPRNSSVRLLFAARERGHPGRRSDVRRRRDTDLPHADRSAARAHASSIAALYFGRSDFFARLAAHSSSSASNGDVDSVGTHACATWTRNVGVVLVAAQWWRGASARGGGRSRGGRGAHEFFLVVVAGAQEEDPQLGFTRRFAIGERVHRRWPRGEAAQLRL